MVKMNGIEKGEISLTGFARLITEISENKSNALLPRMEAQTILHNTSLVRNLIRGKRDLNVYNYTPMPIENELEKAEYFFLTLVSNEIISNTKKDFYTVDTLGVLWNDFSLAHKFEKESLQPWNSNRLAVSAKNALTEVLVKILKIELTNQMSEERRDQLMLGLSEINSSYSSSDPMAEKTAALIKEYDPNNKYNRK